MRAAYYSRAQSYSRSYNAIIAEEAGRMPATRAARAWGFRNAAELRQWVTTREWHHVGKFAACVDYYDVAQWLDDMTEAEHPFADLAGLSKSMTRAGLRRAVHGIVAARLSADYRTRFMPGMNRKPLSARRRELSERHGVSFADAKHSDLCDAGAAMFAAVMLEHKRRKDMLNRRLLFQIRMRQQLQFVNPRMLDHVRDKRWRDRFDAIVRQHGHTFASSKVRRSMRKDKIPLTLANYRQALSLLKSS